MGDIICLFGDDIIFNYFLGFFIMIVINYMVFGGERIGLSI